MTYQALLAAEKLAKDDVSVEVIARAYHKATRCGNAASERKEDWSRISIEEAQVAGGLGGALAELFSEEHPTPLHRMGMKGSFWESGQPTNY